MDAKAEKKLIIPKLLQEGCVLQRGDHTRIWGWYQAGQEVVIEIQDNHLSAICDETGYFEVFVTLTAGADCELLIFADEDAFYHNHEVYVGDVFVCSGQSNVELPITRVREMFPEEMGSVMVHEYKVEEDPEFHEELTEHRKAYWRRCIGEELEKVSALSFFFAKQMREEEKVPIGFINISKGGTPIEAWMGRDVLKDYPDTMRLWKEFENDDYRAEFLIEQQKREIAWHENLTAQEETGEIKKEHFELTLPGVFAEQGLSHFTGLLHLKKTFRVNAGQAGKKAVLRMGTLIDSDKMYINGTYVGETGYCYPPRIYTIPEGVLKEGENELLIRLEVWNGRGMVIGGKKHNITVEDGSVIDLEGVYDAQIRAVSEPMPPSEFMIYKPTVMFQGMTAPCFPCTVKGVVWYQGESNGADAIHYEELLTKFIENWRAHWKQDRLPFVIVQLPVWAMDGFSDGSWAVIRKAQAAVAEKLPDVGLAVTLDTGEWNDLHPLNKKEVGRRVSLTARKLMYGEDVVASGPVLMEMKKIPEGCEMVFDTVDGSELSLCQGEACDEFEVAGEDGSFKKVEQVILDGKRVLLKDPAFDRLKQVKIRYAWRDCPINGLLRNDTGLVTAPFEMELK